MAGKQDKDSWKKAWDARHAAIEAAIGAKAHNSVQHTPMPFNLGGFADVIWFKRSGNGRVFVTCELLDEPGQIPNGLGKYELVGADRHGDDAIANIISRLARFTCDARLNVRDTMDIEGAVPNGSSIISLLFLEFARFQFEGKPAGLLLCLGITADELAACRHGRVNEVVDALQVGGIYPYTDWTRESSFRGT